MHIRILLSFYRSLIVLVFFYRWIIFGCMWLKFILAIIMQSFFERKNEHWNKKKRTFYSLLEHLNKIAKEFLCKFGHCQNGKEISIEKNISQALLSQATFHCNVEAKKRNFNRIIYINICVELISHIAFNKFIGRALFL